MSLTGKARVAGVMGWPISHSRSPRLHGYWLERYGIDGAYVPFPVRPEMVVEAVRALPKLGIVGCNLTLPHKELALAALDEIDPAARRIGAVNTIVVRPDSSIFGTNTDAYGFLEHLKASAPRWKPTAGPAVVLGAGGAARAVCAALVDAGVPRVLLANRTAARAEAVAKAVGGPIEIADWHAAPRLLADAALLVNTTWLGMRGQPPLEVSLDCLPPEAVVDDIVYVPLETDLLREARARGNPTVDGLGMLLHQGRPAFHAFFGVDPAVTPELHALMLPEA